MPDVNSVPPIEPTPPVAPPTAPPAPPTAPPTAPPAPPVAPPAPPAPPGYYAQAAQPAQYGPSAPPYGPSAPQYVSAVPQYAAYGGSQQYPYYAPPRPPQGLSVASLVLGIAGAFFAFFYGFGLFPAIAAVITGHLARKRQPHARSMSLAGLITGYIGIGISLLWVIAIIALVGVAASSSRYGGN